jgi:hypothetical protein
VFFIQTLSQLQLAASCPKQAKLLLLLLQPLEGGKLI